MINRSPKDHYTISVYYNPFIMPVFFAVTAAHFSSLLGQRPDRCQNDLKI